MEWGRILTAYASAKWLLSETSPPHFADTDSQGKVEPRAYCPYRMVERFTDQRAANPNLKETLFSVVDPVWTNLHISKLIHYLLF